MANSDSYYMDAVNVVLAGSTIEIAKEEEFVLASFKSVYYRELRAIPEEFRRNKKLKVEPQPNGNIRISQVSTTRKLCYTIVSGDNN